MPGSGRAPRSARWNGPRRRIEVSRRAHTTELISDPSELLALAADYPIDRGVPVYDLDDAAGLIDLIEREVLQK